MNWFRKKEKEIENNNITVIKKRKIDNFFDKYKYFFISFLIFIISSILYHLVKIRHQAVILYVILFLLIIFAYSIMIINNFKSNLYKKKIESEYEYIKKIKEYEIKEKDTDQKFKKLFFNSPEMYFILEANNITIIDANYKALNELNYELNELIGKNFNNSITHYYDKNIFLEGINKDIFECDIRLIKKNSEFVHVKIKGFRFFDSNIKKIFLSCRNITEDFLKNEKLKQSNIIVENSPVILAKWDCVNNDWPLFYISENVKTQLGYSPKEITEKKYVNIIHRDDLTRVVDEVNHYHKNNVEKYVQEYRLIDKNNNIHWIEDNTTVEYDENKRPKYHQGVIYDITFKKNITDKMLKINQCFLRFDNNSSNNINRLMKVLCEILNADYVDFGIYSKIKRKNIFNYCSKNNDYNTCILHRDLFFDSVIENKKDINYLEDINFTTIEDKILNINPKLSILKKNKINEDEIAYLYVFKNNDILLLDSDKDLMDFVFSLIITEYSKYIVIDNLINSSISYKNVLDSISDLIYIQDEDGVFLDINKKVLETYSLSKDEIIGKTLEILSPNDKNDFFHIKKYFNNAYEGIPQKFEFRSIKNNQEFLQEITLTKSKYMGRDVVIAVAKDITEKKLHELENEKERKDILLMLKKEIDKFLK